MLYNAIDNQNDRSFELTQRLKNTTTSIYYSLKNNAILLLHLLSCPF